MHINRTYSSYVKDSHEFNLTYSKAVHVNIKTMIIIAEIWYFLIYWTLSILLTFTNDSICLIEKEDRKVMRPNQLFMITCAHPFVGCFAQRENWKSMNSGYFKAAEYALSRLTTADINYLNVKKLNI